MPNEIYDITRFEGVIGVTEARDLPRGAALDAKNCDPLAPGAFSPLPDDDSVGQTLDGVLFGVFDDGDSFVWHNATNVRSATGLGGTISAPANLEAVGYTGSYSIAASGEDVRMGLGNASATAQPTQGPRWIGEIFHGQFGGAAPSGTQIELAQLVADCIGYSPEDSGDTVATIPTLVSTADGYDNGKVVLFLGFTYYYYITMIFDGIQESAPVYVKGLNVTKTNGDIGGGGSLASASGLYHPNSARGYMDHTFTFRVRTESDAQDKDELPARVSAIRIYRQEQRGSAIDDEIIVGDLQFHTEIDLVSATGWSGLTPSGAPGDDFDISADTLKKYTFTDDKSFYPETYLSKTGIEAFVLEEELRYGLAAVAEGYHIVGRVWHSRYKDIGTWIFRSKRGRFDMFDWTLDFLKLPTEIEAIITFAGRVYCFGDGVTYVVNPHSLDHEDTWEGIGCPDPRSVAVSDAGMFWGDANNIYLHDGTRLHSIGEAVLRNQTRDTAAWLERTAGVAPISFYDSRWNAFVICYESSAAWYGYMYHLPTKRWSPLTFSGSIIGSLYRKNGVPIIARSAADALDAFDKSTNRSWDATLHTMRTIGLLAVYKHAYVEWDAGEPTLEFFEDDHAMASPNAWVSPTSAGSNIKKGRINTLPGGAWQKVRTFAIKISGDGTKDCSNISLIRRLMTPR